MQLGDVSIRNNVLFIRVKWTKTLQAENDWLILPATKTGILCPVNCWLNYRDVYLRGQASPNDPILLFRSGEGFLPCTGDSFRHKFNHLVDLAGFGELNYTPHSLRRGGASFFANKGVKFRCD